MQSCDIYGPPLLCKAIAGHDTLWLSCGHIFGFLGKYGDFPALMDSARARLTKTQTAKRPCRNAGSENAGLAQVAITYVSPSQLSVSALHKCHIDKNSFRAKLAPAYAALR